ncbi:MAG: hypothetical protein IK100_00390 [Muribaculaceae bacterium]|nr:hypothetical protein [Muribaculaceae bacterium]
MNNSLTTISTTSRSLFNRYYDYLWRHDFKTMTSTDNGKYSITVLGLKRKEADALIAQLKFCFGRKKTEEAAAVAA